MKLCPNDNDRPWINIRFIKAVLAGSIIFFGFVTAGLFRANFMVEPTTLFTELVTTFVVPLVIVYLVAIVSNKILMRFGFEGFWSTNSQNDSTGCLQLVGMLVGVVIGIAFLFFSISVWAEIQTYVEIYRLNEYFEQMSGCLFVAGIVVILWYRFRKIRLAKEAKMQDLS